jgi:precorrin-2 dehydrogenase/sirohydrochlorin ferrochelatase
MSLFPIFLKLTGRHCIVIGAGHLAESKIASLLAADARISVIAPEANVVISELSASGEITLDHRRYQSGDLADAFLVVAATDDPAVNRAVFAEATATFTSLQSFVEATCRSPSRPPATRPPSRSNCARN